MFHLSGEVKWSRTTVEGLVLMCPFYFVMLQLVSKAQQAKQNAEEAGRSWNMFSQPLLDKLQWNWVPAASLN